MGDAPVNRGLRVPDRVWGVINRPHPGSIFKSLAFWAHAGQAAKIPSHPSSCGSEPPHGCLRAPPTHLWRRRGVPVAGQHLQRDAAAAVPQQLLEVVGVAPDLAAVHFADDVADVQHALPVDGAAVQDPRDHHFSPLRAERHPLKEGKCHFHHAGGGLRVTEMARLC